VTLLEVTVTLTIASALALIVAQAFRLGSRSWEQGERRAEAEQRIRTLSGILVQRLASLHPAMAKVNGKPVLAFQGRSDRIFFYSAPDGQGPLPYAAMMKGQALFVEPGRGLIVQESYPLVEGEVFLEPRGSRAVLDPRAVRINFRYLSPPAPGETLPRWVHAWDPREADKEIWGPGQPGAAGGPPLPPEGRFPLAVELLLTVGEERGEREIGLLVPIRVGRTI
jgi:hypothetical protein